VQVHVDEGAHAPETDGDVPCIEDRGHRVIVTGRNGRGGVVYQLRSTQSSTLLNTRGVGGTVVLVGGRQDRHVTT
jgi:hypothetical protein